MKVIDLLNKIANGEIPKTIVYDERYFIYDDKRQNYFAYDDSEIDWKYTVMEYINDEVEILEEEPRDINVCGSWFTKSEYDKLILEEEKKIPEKLEEYIHTDSLNYNQCNYMFEKLTNKYNELIDYLKSKGE